MPEQQDTPSASNSKTPQEGDLLVWWVPQVPGFTFEVPVNSLREASLLLNTLADYDLFQLEHKIKPDYANAGGLFIYEDGQWTDWTNEVGEDIETLSLLEVAALDEERNLAHSAVHKA